MILGDVLSRLHKLIGYNVTFLTGLDVHGNKVAKAAGSDIISYLNNKNDKYQQIAQQYRIEYDKWIFTEDKEHKDLVCDFWNLLKLKGYIYKGKYAGYYSISDETFYKEEEIIRNDDILYAPTGSTVTFQEFDCYFFKGSILQQKIIDFYKANDKFLIPENRANECLGFISIEYRDLCISRSDKSWGIKTPDDDHTIYVWFDALLNYLIEWKDKTHILQIVGKDILIFHGVHFIAILMAADIKIADHLLVHNWWLFDNEKMSKSKGNVVMAENLLEIINIEIIRFGFIYTNLISSDKQFDLNQIINIYNTYLVNKISNLHYRVLSILLKHNITIENHHITYDRESKIKYSIEKYDINLCINLIIEWANDLNSYVEENKIWSNLDLAQQIFQEILSLLKYIEAILGEKLNINKMLFTMYKI